MTRCKNCASWGRWALLIIALCCTAVWLLWVMLVPGFEFLLDDKERLGFAGTPLLVSMPKEPWPWYYLQVIGILGILLLAQWFFLRSKRGWIIRLSEHARPMKTSILAASLMAMLLSVGLIASLMEIPDQWAKLANFDEGWWPVWTAMAVLWLVWAVIFAIYWKAGDRYTQLSRMIRGLIAGSVLEMLVATPIHAYCYNRDGCYCARGSYTGLILGSTVLVWAFGPGVVLLFLREKYRREKLLTPPDSSNRT